MTTRTTSAETERLAGALVTYSARLVRAVSRRTAQEVPAATLRLLSQLEELGPVGVSQLAVADRCSQPTMSAAVKHLTDKGWARKDANPDDARSCLVTLTSDGLAVLKAARRRNAAVVAERLAADPRHTEADLESAVTLIQHLLDNIPDEGNQ
ncbi:MAG TPA: MarR family transcriptional regulator [Nocardioidaceae bacterium]|nr:MarR family transcriptional regulator [Nocardioidaceae bacterium]